MRIKQHVDMPKRANAATESKEAYKQRHAKIVLYRELVKENSTEEFYCNFGALQWRSNYGVFRDLPFHSLDGVYYFETSEGISGNLQENDDPLAWFDKSISRGDLLFETDICIFHKGSPIYFIEIVHKKQVSKKKLKAIETFFKGNALTVFKVQAEDVLSCTNIEQLKNIHLEVVLEINKNAPSEIIDGALGDNPKISSGSKKYNFETDRFEYVK